MDLRLRPVVLDDEPAVRAAQAAMAPEEFEFAIDLRPDTEWPAYVALLDRLHAGLEVPAGPRAGHLPAPRGGRALGAGSIAVIERGGGRLDPDWSHSDDDPPRRRYWIA